MSRKFTHDLERLGLQYRRLYLDSSIRDWLLAFSLPSFLLILLNLFVHPLVKGITGIGVELFIKVVLIGSQSFFALPFHVLNQTSKPPFDFSFVFGGPVNIPDRSSN
jgi:hypothetical protein